MPETVQGIAFNQDSFVGSQDLFVKGFAVQILKDGDESSGNFFAYSRDARFSLPGILREVLGEIAEDWILTDDSPRSVGFIYDRQIDDIRSYFRGERPAYNERATENGRDMFKLIYDAVASGREVVGTFGEHNYRAVPTAELAIDLAGTPPPISL